MDLVKTDGTYNEDDFVQRDSILDELTVTITLCEYRNLIRAIADYEHEIDRLAEEKKALEKKVNSMSDCLQNPGVIREVGKAIRKVADMWSRLGEEDDGQEDNGNEDEAEP